MIRNIHFFEPQPYIPPPLPPRRFIDPIQDETNNGHFFVGMKKDLQMIHSLNNSIFSELNSQNSLPKSDIRQEIVECTDIILNCDYSSINAKNLIFKLSKVRRDVKLCYSIHKIITEKVQQFARKMISNFLTIETVYQLGSQWKNDINCINHLSSLMSPLCIKEMRLAYFDIIFSQEIINFFNKNSETFQKISNFIISEFLNNLNMADNIENLQNAFLFIYSTGDLFNNIFLPNFIHAQIEYYRPIVEDLFFKFDYLSDYFKEISNLENNIKNSITCLHLPNFAQNDLIVSFHHLVFAEKLDDICKRGLRHLILDKDHQTIEKCTEYARSTDTISTFTHELSFDFESVAEDCFKHTRPIKSVIEIMKTLGYLSKVVFNAEQAKMLKDFFDKGFNSTPELAARLLAEEINNIFLNDEEQQNPISNIENTIINDSINHSNENNFKDKLDILIKIFRVLQCKDVFEAYHHLLLSRRILMLKSSVVHADELFAIELRNQCGPEYTKRIDSIFEDLHKSIQIAREFVCCSNSPKYFKVLVLNQANWTHMKQTPLEVPSCIRQSLTQFAQFYCMKNPKKKIGWNHHFSRVKLQVNNETGIKEIICNGISATILYLFNVNKKLTLKQICELCKGSENEIDECVKWLKTKKNGKIITFIKNSNEIEINQNPKTDQQIISLPFISTTVPHAESERAKYQIGTFKANQIDAAIMSLLKKEKSMDKYELKTQIKSIITFRLEDELYEKELENLAKKWYLKLDASGRVHYLP
ncbi:Cullin family protein [Tritrichomonas foetus]|uniref:Cullin family protein n=1 Tax=Tritrichomonas foetus TaxID=1144522 RepID=A0A1J4K8M7_9EUKA|nr:Cullin family protein [Tritrichomonas foetus]|eukprot:OHT06022.1 Cullin family protein [Tritrichomonas foetus]